MSTSDPPSGKLVAVEVELTIESPEGEQSHVSASGTTYEDALAKATELVPEGYRRIVIRKHPTEPSTGRG